ncbi:MAG: M28 family peptidase [Phycisphaerales bacterium]|nr:M28 family peptidase [Phycisphaerales bacterium]
MDTMLTQARRTLALLLVAGVAAAICTPIASARSSPPTEPPAAPAKAPPEFAPDLAAQIATITPDSLMTIVKALPAKRSPGPTDEHREGLNKTRAMLSEMATKLGYTPRIEPVAWKKREFPKPAGAPAEAPKATPDEPTKPAYGNVIFEIRGVDRPREVVIVGAHFDAVPAAPGADDNGSGVAGLMEIARVMRDRKPARTVRFVLFDLEEIGLVGAVQHLERWNEAQAALPADERESIALMLSLDGIGYYDEAPGSQKNPFSGVPGLPKTGSAGDFIAIATISKHSPIIRRLDKHMREGSPELKTVVVDVFPIAPPDLLRSDHAPFMLQGHPAAIVADSANFRNPHYHQPTDTPETLNPPFFARTVRGLAYGVIKIADEVPPVPRPKGPQKPEPPPVLPPAVPAPASGDAKPTTPG